jgi:serine/threonine protein kinase
MYPEKMKQKQAIQEREIEVMRSLRHRNVVELLDVVVRSSSEKAVGRQPYMFLIFEYAAGGDFAAYLKQQPGKKLSEAKTRHWMTQLRDGLMFLSQQKILHRDLKPQNLLLSHKDESVAVLKLADFGFARFIHAHSMIETVW